MLSVMYIGPLKMHQNRWQRSPDTIVGFKWPTSKGKGRGGAKMIYTPRGQKPSRRHCYTITNVCHFRELTVSIFHKSKMYE